MESKNIDDLIVASEQQATNNEQAPVQAISTPPTEPVEKVTEEPVSQELDDKTEETVQESSLEPEETNNAPKASGKNEETGSPIDEYGNPVEKPRMYTEEELQQRIRIRLKEKYGDQQTPPQMQQTAKDFKPDPASDDSWETQLEAFVEKTIEKRQAKISEQQWKQQEQERQAEFEYKFTSGMGKYKDFHQVVSGKSITDEIMLATRGLENPAAFIYGAAKLHPQELDRISRLADPYQVAAEVGRLHEKMVKTRNMASRAAKPLEPPKGDMPIKTNDQPSLESRINQYAQQKLKRGR